MKMTEGRAIGLIIVPTFIAFIGVCFLLDSLNADGILFGLAMMLMGGAASYGSSLVVIHYSDSDFKRHRR